MQFKIIITLLDSLKILFCWNERNHGWWHWVEVENYVENFNDCSKFFMGGGGIIPWHHQNFILVSKNCQKNSKCSISKKTIIYFPSITIINKWTPLPTPVIINNQYQSSKICNLNIAIRNISCHYHFIQSIAINTYHFSLSTSHSTKK